MLQSKARETALSKHDVMREAIARVDGGFWGTAQNFRSWVAASTRLKLGKIRCGIVYHVPVIRVTANRDDDPPGVLAQQALAVVKRALTADRTWGGKAIDTKVTGSDIDLVTYADRSVVGVCQATVQYRYSHLDPRDPNPDM